LLDQLITAEPDEETAKRVYNRGLAHAKNSELDAAVARLDQALAISPGLAAAWGLLGDLEIARGNLQRAVECGDKLVAIEGSRERGLELRYRALEAMGDEAAAAEALKALAAENPDAVIKGLFERANDLFDNNQAGEAAKLYRQVLDVEPDNARAHYKLGLALLSSEDLENAKVHLQRFVELAPDDPEAASARDMLSYLN
jgi:tetratricopeptide (TPR) repeat protein